MTDYLAKLVGLVFVLLLPASINASSAVNLSEAEQLWLKNNPSVKFTGDPNWLPYEAFDEEGNYIGIVSEHLLLISDISGLTFKMSPSKTWTESTEKAKQGLVDILSETDDSDLKSHLNFTKPYISNPIVIAMGTQENYVESIRNIKNKKIALIKDYGYAAKIRRKYSNIQFVTVDDIQDGLISVSTGKVDALLCTLALCSYTISELGLNNVKIVGKTEFDTKLAFGVQKSNPELLSILNKAINNISKEKQQTILDGWIKNKFPIKTDYTLVYQISIVAILILTIFIIWNRRLFREINLRKKTEEELKAAEEVLRVSNQRLVLHREHTPIGVIEWNTDFEFLDWNPAAQRIFGFNKEEVLGRHITETILPESAREAVDIIWSDLLAQKGGTYSLNENETKDGRIIMCEWHNTPLVDHSGKVIGVTSLVEDITERQRNEENIRQTQKMDAIGKLTGGIAHDFNNMLGVILGFSELLKESITHDDPKQLKYCNEIINATKRAKLLTRKLLEFSRIAPSSDSKTLVNELLKNMQHMLEKTLTYRIKLDLDLAENLWPVMLDKTRLEDAILNICINAMHAMPDGGSLKINTINIPKNKIHQELVDLHSEDYVLLTIEDTGIGMSEEVKQKMFDPFFTTKGTGGTGLGMSQVYGFVQQLNGHIHVDSESGKGTRICIYIPKLHESTVEGEENKDKNKDEIENHDINEIVLPISKKSILVVDDEVALLDLAEEVLTNYGYTVLRAENAEQALNVLKDNSVDLLLSDVIMPGMDGYQLATEVEKLYPDVIIQMVSGYSEEHEVNLDNINLRRKKLDKPISSQNLLRRLSELLGE